jgi:hypothetical protein
MSYIGSTPITQSFISGTDYFNGTGAQTAFTLSRTVASVNDIQAVVNNVVQVPNDAYTISGTTITFTSAPSSGTQNVYVRYLSTTTQAITPSQGTVSWNTLDSNVQGDLGISFKNRIINGNMVISQRGTSSFTAADNLYTLDRWVCAVNPASKFTVIQSSDAPAGFTNSLLVTSSSAYTVGAAEYETIVQRIEGYNIADLGFGTASAKTITISFWVKSSLTGSFGAAITNIAETRCYPFSYTINTANTWEQKSVTIPGDTSGSWATTTSTGINLYISLGTGTNLSGTANAWTGSTKVQPTGSVSVVGTNGATWYLTGVMLEVGTQATTFTLAGGSYGAELALCQRYFQTYGYGVNGTTGDSCIGSGMFYTASELLITAQFLVIMRAVPTYSCATVTNGFRYHRAGAATNFDTVPYFGSTSTSAAIVGSLSVPVSGTAGYATQVYAQASGAKINFSAEL